MEKTKLVAMRLPESLIKRINEFTVYTGVRSRSFVVIKLLDVILSCAEHGTILQMLVKRYPREKGFVIRFEVEKGKIAERLEAEKADKT